MKNVILWASVVTLALVMVCAPMALAGSVEIGGPNDSTTSPTFGTATATQFLTTAVAGGSGFQHTNNGSYMCWPGGCFRFSNLTSRFEATGGQPLWVTGGLGSGAANAADGLLFDNEAEIQWPDTKIAEVGTTLAYTAATHSFPNATVSLGASTLDTDGNSPHRYRGSTLTVVDDGAGTSPVATISSYLPNRYIDCQDTNNCTAVFSETSAVDGYQVCLTVISTNTVTFADTAGVSELSAAHVAGQWDTLCVQYITDRWVQKSFSNN